MRALPWIVVASTGCRTILGIEEASEQTPPMDDAPYSDTVTEAPPQGCPTTYQTLPNSGPRGHRYKALNVNASWIAQRDACAGEGTFLAFPDGPTFNDAALELVAVNDFQGSGNWFGVNDIAAEGTYRTSLGNVVSAATLSLIGPGDAGRDCLKGSSTELSDEQCTSQRKAVCECIP